MLRVFCQICNETGNGQRRIECYRLYTIKAVKGSARNISTCLQDRCKSKGSAARYNTRLLPGALYHHSGGVRSVVRSKRVWPRIVFLPELPIMDWQWDRPGLACSYWQQCIVRWWDALWSTVGKMSGLEVRLGSSLHLMVGSRMVSKCNKQKDGQQLFHLK